MERAVLTLSERLAFFAGCELDQAEHLLRGLPLSFEEAMAGGADAQTLRSLMARPERLTEHRIDLNALRERQVRRLPRMARGRVVDVLHGGPYYSLEEFEIASGVSRPLLRELLRAPSYRKMDKTTGRRTVLRPITGLYIAQGPREWEGEPRRVVEGFEIVHAHAAKWTTLFLRPAPEFEQAAPVPHRLKRALGGRVFPAVRDAAGLVRRFVPLRVDVWMRQSVNDRVAEDILKRAGLELAGRPLRDLAGSHLYPAQLPEWPAGDPLADTLAAAVRAQQFEEVVFAEPDEFGLEDFEPGHTVSADTGELESSGRYWNHLLIDLAGAHQITRGKPSVTVFIVDSGMRTDHPALATALREDWAQHDLNFSAAVPESERSPDDLQIGHGTKVASVALAQGNEAEISDVVVGVAPGCRLIPIKIDGRTGAAEYGLR
ncbi:MAG: S8 family serine peptidase, partial [Gammaproteobacteria bacterium]|nr:S8 family serine peptidase [Gammaproteobacteria bacterium]